MTTSRLQAAFAGVVAILLLIAAPAAWADDDDLGGFDDDAGFDDDLGGFDDDAGFDDDLGGFEDEEPSADEEEAEKPAITDRWWDIDGSVSNTTSIAYLSHEANNPPLNTDWTGLTRWRLRLNLQLDAELPWDFDLRLSPYIFYDFSYIINGRSNFSEEVLDTYEWEWDFQDSYIEGPLLDDLDIKIGRQVVNWGRSDSLRVIDVLNPLDQREPGRAEIEDLRWAVGMLKLDWHVGDFTVTGIAIPEIRVDTLPVFGDDFYSFPIAAPKEMVPKDFENWEFAAAVRGIFTGWDASVHYAYVFNDLPRLQPEGDNVLSSVLTYDRLHMAGAGANYTRGSWLGKAEVALLKGFRYAQLASNPILPPTVSDKKSRLDTLLGVEYYGFSETTLAIEVVNRHIFDYERVLFSFPTALRENSVQYAVRITRDWLNARLSTTVLGIILGYKAQDGAIIRFQGDYTLRDGLVATAGMILYQAGELPPISGWGRNDRVFIDLKWSF